GKTAIVEHDGPCILIVRRTYFPGWSYTLDDAAPHPVLKVNSGMQGVALEGAGTRRIAFQYRPTGLTLSAAVSLFALASALAVLISAGGKAVKTARVGGRDRGGIVA